jgi:hypothetical protein
MLVPSPISIAPASLTTSILDPFLMLTPLPIRTRLLFVSKAGDEILDRNPNLPNLHDHLA